ncbi:TPA: LemA family protein [Candidatus Woesearchaeota archaeon]|nr:LemA family protein [Candidatus Woesearchaeota archaeon]
MNALTIAAIAASVVILLIIFIYNGLIRNRNQVKNAFSQIDVQLKRRNDLIPNLIETVKGYLKHEQSVLENITKARSAVLAAETVGAKSKASNMLSETLKSLFAVSENYPKLQANQNFLQLQEELTGTESKIAYARQHYNDMVTAYDNSLETFPNNAFAKMFGFKKEELFEAAEAERKNVKVQF